MADQKNDRPAPKADTPAAAAEAVKAVPQAAVKASDAAVDAVAEAVKAGPRAVAATVAAVADGSKAAPAKRSYTRRAPARAKTAKAAPAAQPKKAAAPKRAAAQAATAKTSNTIHANIKTQGTTTMKNETKQAADRFQAVFGDVNERAKSVMERNIRLGEELTELSKGNVEAIVASTKVAAKGVETIGQEIAEFNRKSFEDASAALKSFAEVKSPTDFFRLQSDFARGQFDALVAETSKLSEQMIKVAGEVAQPIASRYSVAAERVRTVVAA
jgi:phasin family protein